MFKLLLTLPALYIAGKALDGSLGAWQFSDLQVFFGRTAVILLNFVLCLTPLKVIFPRWSLVAALNGHRRAIGISCFLYAAFHGSLYFYQAAGPAEIVRDFQQFLYLWLGLTGVVLLAPLFLTSSDFAVRLFTYKWWKRLHRLAYVAAFVLFFHRAFGETTELFSTILIFTPLIFLESLRILVNMFRAVVRKPEKKVVRQEAAWSDVREFRVDRIVLEAEAIRSFYLKPLDGKKLAPYKAGQFLTFRFDIPGQDKPVVRCYSLSDSPGHDYHRISVKRIAPPHDKPDVPPGLSSSHLHDHVKEGDTLKVLAPNGDFVIAEGKLRNIVLLGAGIGITPVLSMLNYINATGIKSDSNIWFFYGVRNGSEQIRKDHFKSLAEANPNGLTITLCYSDPSETDIEGKDFQRHSWVSVDLLKEMLPDNNFDFYFCGPGPMMSATAEGLEAWGVPDERIHFEAFGPSTVKRKKADTHTGESFQVTLDQTGKTLTWTGEAENILGFAEANGITLPFGCRMGQCGSCSQKLVKGEVDYPVAPSYTPKKGYCLTCTSVPVSDIELSG